MSTVDADDLTWQQPPDPEPLVPATPRELKGLMKDWRSGRATRNVLEAISDAYVALIGAVMIGAMIINVVLKAQSTVAQCSTVSCLSARTILPLAAFAAAVAVALAASRLFGPVLASAAEGFWLLDAPISRAKLLAVPAGRRDRGLLRRRRGDRRADLGTDRIEFSRGAGLGRRDRAVRRGFGGLRGGAAGCRAAPADPCRDLRLRPARRRGAVRCGGRGRPLVRPGTQS